MYNDIQSDVNSIFASATWQAENINAFPDNYDGDKGNDEFIIVKVMPTSSAHASYERSKEITGLIGIRIFVRAGEGQGRVAEIADILDVFLQNELLTTGTRLGTSYLSMDGLDAANKSLYAATYMIPFTKFGE